MGVGRGGMGITGEKRLVQLAMRQFGVVTTRDIGRCQVPRRVLGRRLESGEWIRLQRGIFKLGSSNPTVNELEMAVMLAADRAVLSHNSAAARLGLSVPRVDSVQIIVPLSRRPPRLSGVRVWRSRDLLPSEVTKRGPFRLTHLARTIIDLASVLDEGWLRAALDSALRQRRTNLAWISRALNERG
jgi:predicted transcriptional regulator of viral defense system